MEENIRENKNSLLVEEYLKNYDSFINKLASNIKSRATRLEFEDIKQDLILRLLISAEKYDEKRGTHINTYLSAVAINEAKSIIRDYYLEKNKINNYSIAFFESWLCDDDYVNRYSGITYIEEPSESFLYPNNYALSKRFDEALEEVYTALKKTPKKIFNLYVKGVQIEEIAKMVKRSNKTVYNCLMEIKKKIKSKL